MEKRENLNKNKAKKDEVEANPEFATVNATRKEENRKKHYKNSVEKFKESK